MPVQIRDKCVDWYSLSSGYQGACGRANIFWTMQHWEASLVLNCPMVSDDLEKIYSYIPRSLCQGNYLNFPPGRGGKTLFKAWQVSRYTQLVVWNNTLQTLAGEYDVKLTCAQELLKSQKERSRIQNRLKDQCRVVLLGVLNYPPGSGRSKEKSQIYRLHFIGSLKNCFYELCFGDSKSLNKELLLETAL